MGNDWEDIKDRVLKPKYNTLFLTVTIKPKLYIKSAQEQFAYTINRLIRILDMYCYDYSYVTELTEQVNVHYHAWIELKILARKPFFINEFKKDAYLGFCMINKEPITEIDRTYFYMMDTDNKKTGKNLKAAYEMIKKREVAGHRSNINIENKVIIENNNITIKIKYLDNLYTYNAGGSSSIEIDW